MPPLATPPRPLRALLGVVLFFFAGATQGEPEAARALADKLSRAAGGQVEVVTSPDSGLAIFVAAKTRAGIPLRVPASTPAAERALAFLSGYGDGFGLGARPELAVRRVSPVDEVGVEHVRVQQLHQGIPVTAGELVVHLRGTEVVAVNGEALIDLESVPTEPVVTPSKVGELVRERLEKHLGVTDAKLSEPRLEILNRGLLEKGRFPTRLAWFVEATRLDLRELFWIDAEQGDVLLQFSQLTDARSRSIHNGANGSVLPGALARAEGGPASGDADVDKAYDFSGDTYDYFFDEHGRDSYDGAGAALVSTVHHCPTPGNCPYFNAFWNGTQMVYGDGFPQADDVAAHELTHAVTEATAGLFYYQQSGALNESFSDIFGETVDLINGAGTDTAGVRWKLGEDVPGLGAIRDLNDPNLFNDPGKTSDAEFVCEDPGGDNGGVHSNSGVPNHAYALMVDGGTYNGFTVTGIGLTKAGKIQYRVLSQYLLSGSNFLDDANALRQACQDLIGVSGISAADCDEVEKAVLAVELASYSRCSPSLQWELPPCLAGAPTSVVFFDDLESGSGNWSVANGAGSVVGWSLGSGFAVSGTKALVGTDFNSANDSSLLKTTSVVLPSKAVLHFHHAFGFENSGAEFYDGGVVEYSTNNGASWLDGGSLIDAGAAYSGTLLADGSLNALAGRGGFVADSFGYTTTRLNLVGLAGQSFRFRFRLGSDQFVGDVGWFLDDVGIYVCPDADAMFADGFESGDRRRWSSSVP